MKRRPHSRQVREVDSQSSSEAPQFLTRLRASRWLTTTQAAAYLGKFRKKDGEPSQGAIRNMIYRKQIAAQKFFGRILIDSVSLDQLIKSSPKKGVI